MSSIPPITNTPNQVPQNAAAASLTGANDAAPAGGGGGDLRDVDMDQFLQLLIAELQNQDPLSPMENSEILQQISQIREIGATNVLTETLQAVLTGQNLTTASSLIGKHVTALDDESEPVEGIVERVSVETSGEDDDVRTLRVHIGPHAVKLKNVREVVEAEG